MRGDCFMGFSGVRIRRLVSFNLFEMWMGLFGSLLTVLGMTAFAEKKKPEWSHE